MKEHNLNNDMCERPRLDMLELVDPEFFDNEEKALDMLPVNQKGLEELARYRYLR